MGAIAFDDNGFRRTVAAVKRVELMPYGSTDEPYPDTGNDGNYDDWVKVTGAISGVWYPGILQRYTESTDTWADVTGATCHIKGPNGETLTNGNRYRGNIVDTHSGATAYQAISGPAGAAGGLLVKEVDGSPSQSGVTTMQVDQVTGGKVTVNSATDVTVSWLSASKTQIGVVDLSSQVLGDGLKRVSVGFIVNNDKATGNAFTVYNGDGSTKLFEALANSTAASAQVAVGPIMTSTERMTVDLAGAIGDGWRFISAASRATAIGHFYTSGGLLVFGWTDGTDKFFEVTSCTNSTNAALKVQVAIDSSFGYVIAQTRFQVGANVGVTATQGVGQRCVFVGGICTGVV